MDMVKHRTFHIYQHMTSFCALRWLGKDVRQPTRTKQILVLMLDQWLLYSNSLNVNARDRYGRKLDYSYCADKLPDPYFMQNDPMCRLATFAIASFIVS